MAKIWSFDRRSKRYRGIVWKRGDRVRLIDGTARDSGHVDAFVPDTGWTVVVRDDRTVIAGPSCAFERLERVSGDG